LVFMMKISSLASVLLTLFPFKVDAVTLTTTSSAYTVDAGSANSFQFTVSRSSCDVTSIKYMGNEVQYQSTASHIGSGLGTATVSATTVTCKYPSKNRTNQGGTDVA
jgi:rhamnogalacturonan endolyase